LLAFIDGAEDLPSPQRKALAFNHRSAPSQPSKYGHLKYSLAGQYRQIFAAIATLDYLRPLCAKCIKV
jgi:hypothetical protein